ncbi:hypothetical protein [Rhizobium sp. L43]|uniref:hypothetical protein n=1 Tax=Rhizobium sp. L43 TaxID=2035452 RepID=UPI000BE7FC0A|nr:hypothetical protein [Rhizobium sp. L43]PDS79164.1 hypothetical protein CO667_10125 [Rhizobium sp. L43]
MEVKAYILTFFAPGLEISRVNGAILNSPYLLKYWNYLPGVYCLTSAHPIGELRAHFEPLFGYSNFLIAEINPFNIDGRLSSSEAWKWFYTAFEPVGPPQQALPGSEANRLIVEALRKK